MLKSTCVCAIIVCAVRVALAEDGATPMQFPFPATVEELGTDQQPVRVSDNLTRMSYVVVPAGTYRIGNDDLADSKAIDVTMSRFYISENQVSCSQIAQYLNHEFAAASRAVAIDSENADGRLAVQIATVCSFWASWPDIVFEGDVSDDLLMLMRVLADRPRTTAGRPRLQDVTLTAKQREAARRVVAAFEGCLEALAARGAEPYERARYENAVAYATWRNVRLPTEAQWECAARLQASGELPGLKWHGGILEWCSDYYAFDYFHREDGFNDPKGPKRGRLSAEQLEYETTTYKWITRLVALNLGVLRGRDVSTRSYGRRAGVSKHALKWFPSKGIRLVFTTADVEGSPLPAPGKETAR